MSRAAPKQPVVTVPEERQLLISEIYASIQGESTLAGRPCIFIRLTGCPLRCRWCDTEHAFTGGEHMGLDDVLAEVERLGGGLVQVTGGEPLAQRTTSALIAALCETGREVLIETSGTLPVADLDPRARVIADMKCPGSGEAWRNRWPILAGLRAMDELKIVVADRTDFDWARGALNKHLDQLEATILWSAVADELPAADLASWLMDTGARGRLQIQLHKVLWPNADRGV